MTATTRTPHPLEGAFERPRTPRQGNETDWYSLLEPALERPGEWYRPTHVGFQTGPKAWKKARQLEAREIEIPQRDDGWEFTVGVVGTKKYIYVRYLGSSNDGQSQA